MKMHRSGREYRRKVDRDDYELEDSRREAENEYYKIQLKVAAKIKQEEERGEGKRYSNREREGENTRVKNDEENSKVEEGVEPEAQRSKERPDDDRREIGGSDDRRERVGSDDRRERGGSDDQRERRSNDRSRANSRENQTNEMLKSEMMKLEKEQAPAPRPPPVVDNNASSDRKPVFYNENENADQKPFNKENQDNKHVVVNNNQNQNGNWNNQNNQNNFKYEPVSEFQSKYQMMANDPNNCKFYMKTGACRFGPRCSRNHLRYENSPTILIPNFFQDPRLAIPMLNERRTDSGMEYDEVEMIHEFEKFYDDVIGEFRAAGNVMMFKCCQNFVPHLRGNVYVQYSKPEYAVEAMKMFNGRFYAGRQLSVELSPVTNWKSSICGLFDKRLCPRGKACNFLHVFRNPGNAYSVPNRTDFDPERAFRSGGYDPSFVNPNHPVFKYYNQRDAYGYRSETAKQTTNPTVTHTRNKWDNDKNEKSRSRSRSRDRDHSSRKRHHSHSRSHSRGRSKSRSHSRSRSRSRSRRRKHSRSKSRSRSHSKSRSKSHSKEKERSKKSPKKTRKHSRSSRSSSRGSTKKKHNNDSDVSDTSTDWSDISLDE